MIADYNEPIFYADNFYWVNRGGIWYSSSWYGGGWGRANGDSPGHILGISHPEGYAHYRPAGADTGVIHGGYAAHAQYRTSHPMGGSGVRTFARGHSGGGGRRR